MKNLKELPTRYDLSVIHVTHNFREASYLADRLGIILKGTLLQTGDVKSVLKNPNSIEVAKFLGFKNLTWQFLHITWKEKLLQIIHLKIVFLFTVFNQ